jgi:hypothetical protein
VLPFDRDPNPSWRPKRDFGAEGRGRPFDREGDGEGHGLDDPFRGRLVDLPDRVRSPGPASEPVAHGPSPAVWLLAPMALCAVAAGTLLVRRGPDQIFGMVFGLVLGLGFLWIVVSALFPGQADRTCPGCGANSLERIDPDATHGLSCRLCSWRDETASAFLHAEEEGPLEDIVLRQRGRGERRW